MVPDDSIYSYSPNVALPIVVACFYGIPTIVLTWQTFLKYHSWFFVCVLIGSTIEVGGYVCRVVSAKNVTEIPPYAISATLIIIAPVFIAAGNYLLIGRLIRAVLPSSRHRIFFIPANRITRVFVCLDIFTFFVQAGGSGAAGDWTGKKAEIGKNIIVGGLALQVATFSWFLSIVLRFGYVTSREDVREDAPKGWHKVLMAIWISSSLILVRCVYRVIEFALGIDGYPFEHEWMFYVFEALPMLPAIGVFCFIHPAKYLGSKGGLDNMEGSERSMQLLESGKSGKRFWRRK